MKLFSSQEIDDFERDIEAGKLAKLQPLNKCCHYFLQLDQEMTKS